MRRSHFISITHNYRLALVERAQVQLGGARAADNQRAVIAQRPLASGEGSAGRVGLVPALPLLADLDRLDAPSSSRATHTIAALKSRPVATHPSRIPGSARRGKGARLQPTGLQNLPGKA